MAENKLKQLKDKRIHFIGIGGCSMSGLALILDNMGYQVTGSDISEGSYTKLLAKANIPYTIGHDPKNVEGAALVVYTAAVKPDNCEYMRAKELNIPVIERAALLGYLSEMYQTAVCIAGCHGKTTITSMVAMILMDSHLDPTIHIGGMMRELGGGVKVGNSDIFLTEACEYVQSFLSLSPTHILVNNIDDDHLDCYRDLEHIYDTFRQFTQKLGTQGVLFGCGDEPLVQRLLRESNVKTVTYGLNAGNDYRAKNIVFDELGHVSYDLYVKEVFKQHFSLQIPGTYNVVNSLAAIALTTNIFDIDYAHCAHALQHYSLTGRRFELLGERNGVKVIHDYAHHPTEIRACIQAALKTPHKKLYVVFQCHLFSRAKTLKDKYAVCFEGADEVLVPDIYPAREKDDGTIHARDLVAAISPHTPALYLSDFDRINDYLKQHAKPGDVVLTVGPGNVNVNSLKFLR